MTIRLTSVLAFEKVLNKLRQDPMYSEEVNTTFFKYCVDDIKKDIIIGNDEWYLDVDWMRDAATCKIVLVLRYHKRSDIMTDEEYINGDEVN